MERSAPTRFGARCGGRRVSLCQNAPEGGRAVIEQDGEVYRRVVLADLKEPLTLEVNGAVIELDKDGAHFVSSPCPDKICVNKGIIKRAGESAVCLPQRVSVRIEGGDSEIDSVTG